MFLNAMWKLSNAVRGFLRQEDGMAVIEIILIIVVFIALVLIFKTQMISIINNIFETISTESSGV